VTITDNGPSGTAPVDSSGKVTFSNYSANAAGTVNYNVSYIFGNLANGSIDMSSYNPQVTTLSGTLTKAGNNLSFTTPMNMTMNYVQSDVPVLGTVTIVTNISADITATAPFQVPEPGMLAMMGMAGIGLLGKVRSLRRS
jgi:hypothetical protein